MEEGKKNETPKQKNYLERGGSQWNRGWRREGNTIKLQNVLIKATYNRPKAQVKLNGENLSGTRQGCLLSPMLFNIVLELINV